MKTITLANGIKVKVSTSKYEELERDSLKDFVSFREAEDIHFKFESKFKDLEDDDRLEIWKMIWIYNWKSTWYWHWARDMKTWDITDGSIDSSEYTAFKRKHYNLLKILLK